MRPALVAATGSASSRWRRRRSPPSPWRRTSTRRPRRSSPASAGRRDDLLGDLPRGHRGAACAHLRQRRGRVRIYDNADVDSRATRWYDADGNLRRRVIHERWTPAWWSNPLTGATVPYMQTNKITDVLAVPGDFGSATETIVSENVYTDPDTHKKVLRSVRRMVFEADGTLDFRVGQRPFLDAFLDGDMSVFDAVCAALAS